MQLQYNDIVHTEIAAPIKKNCAYELLYCNHIHRFHWEMVDDEVALLDVEK